MALSAAGSNSYQFGITKLWLMHQMSLRIGLPWWPSAKNLPAMQVMKVWSLGQEDPLEEELVTHSSILPWKIPCTEESGGLQSMGSQRVRYDWIQTYIFKNKLPQGVCVLPSYCCYCCSVAKSCPILRHHGLCHLFSFCLQSWPASRSFPMSKLFASSGQNIGASGLASVLPMSIQGWYPLGLTGLIS